MREHIGIVVGIGKLGRTVEEFLGSPENRVGFPLDGLGNIERIGFAETGSDLEKVSFTISDITGFDLCIRNGNKAVEEVGRGIPFCISFSRKENIVQRFAEAFKDRSDYELSRRRRFLPFSQE